ncbi:MAG: arylesterase [Hyphomicrobiales bacterium]|nr:MAG: arylesterase [Hyphomicrobiales bacterium]
MRSFFQSSRLFAMLAVFLAVFGTSAASRAEPATIVAFGDSLTAGYMLPAGEGFAPQLADALKARGHDVTVIDAGVSGDTASGGLARLDWSVGEGVDLVIVELGANDALRGIDPAETKKALTGIVQRLKERGIKVLLAGMQVPPNMGPDYEEAFNPIYGEIAEAEGVALYPFFLDGVAADPSLNLADGMHPNPKGVAIIVERIVPAVEKVMGW